MVSESDTGRCASEEAKSGRGWTRGGVPVRMVTLQGVDWVIPHQLERGMSAK